MNNTKNITESARIITRIGDWRGIPRLTVAVWGGAAHGYISHHRYYSTDSSHFEQLEALRALVIDTLYIDVTFDSGLRGDYVATLAKLDALLDEEMAASLAYEEGAE